MNKKIFLSACVTCVLGLFGCAQTQQEYFECTGPNCNNHDDLVCQETNDPALCPGDPFINYTRTAADFKEYGERAPRDYLISQAAEGNNIASTVPPSIEDEVVYYEQQIEKTTKDKVVNEDVPAPVSKPVAAQKSEAADPAPDSSVTEMHNDLPNNYKTATNNPVNNAIVATNENNNIEEEAIEVIEDDIEYVDDDLLDVEVTEEVSEEIDDNEEDIEDPVQDWLAEEGQNLKALITEWSEKSGWRLIWNTNRNYVLSAGAMFRGRFADVSSALIRAFARAQPAPIATFYKGNRVLVVETMEDENAYE